METTRGQGTRWRTVLVPIWLGLAVGCSSDFDTRRVPNPDQSFGADVVELACKRMAYLDDVADGDGRVDVSGSEYRATCRGQGEPPAGAPEDLRALLARRNELTFAIDSAAPEASLPALQALLTSESFLTLYDSDAATGAIDALVALLRFAAEDPGRASAFHDALVRLAARPGYRSLDMAPGLMGAALGYPDVHTAMQAFTAAVDAGGSAEAAWTALLAAAGASLRHAEAAEAPADPERTANLVLGLLFTEEPLPSAPVTPDPQLDVVRRDHRGVARIGRLADGQLPAPFADQDGDGLADLDEAGRFVDASGAPIAAPAPYEPAPGEEATPWPHRDELGRALAGAGGPLLYEHLVLDGTLLAALARDSAGLLGPERGVLLDAMRGASLLMGERVDATQAYASGETLAYRGFDTGSAALLDMIYGYLQLLREPRGDEILALGDELLRDHERIVAELAEAAIAGSRLGDAYPEAALVPGSPLWDDLMDVVRRMAATPGLLEDLLIALETNPEVAELGGFFGSFMRYSDRFSYDAEQRLVGSFATEVDRSRPDTGFDRSIWQRLLHVVADSNGDVLCSKAGAVVEEPIFGIEVTFDEECELFRVDNVGVFFLQSIAYAKDDDGRVILDDDGNPVPKAELTFNSGLVDLLDFFIDMDEFLETRSGIAGFTTHPTPHALGRMLFLPQKSAFLTGVVNPERCRDGHLYEEVHADTLQVWEVEGFYDAIRPVVQVFADHEAEILFVDLMTVLHQHWSSRESGDHQQADPTLPDYAWGSNAVSYEPLIVDILAQEAFLPALVASAPTLNAIRIEGRPFTSVVADTVRFLVEPREGLAKRDGSTSTETNDGEPVPVLSPWYVLADAYARRDAALGAAGEYDAWQRVGRGLIDTLFRGEDVAGAGWRFRNPRTRGTLLVLLDFVRQRIAAHEARGDRDDWLTRDLLGSFEESMASPVGAAILDLMAALARDPAARQPIEGVLGYMLDPGADAAGFAQGLTATADLMQAAMLDDANMLPLAHIAGEAIRPERGWIAPLVHFAHGSSQSDSDGVLAELMRHLFTPHRRGRTPLGEIADGVGEIRRARPHDELDVPFAREDYSAILRGVADFMDEEKRGLRKFIAIIKGRKL
jgi:hypothetical protein